MWLCPKCNEHHPDNVHACPKRAFSCSALADGSTLMGWRWHEKTKSWVGSWRGVAVKVEGSPENGVPHFTPQAWVEGSPDSPLLSNDKMSGSSALCDS
jgi:hypothetical protein